MKREQSELLFDSLPDTFTRAEADELAGTHFSDQRKAARFAGMWLKTWEKSGRILPTKKGFKKQSFPIPPASFYRALPPVFDRDHVKIYAQHSVPKGVDLDHWAEHCLRVWQAAGLLQECNIAGSRDRAGYQKVTPAKGTTLHSSQQFNKSERMPWWEKGTSTDPDRNKQQS